MPTYDFSQIIFLKQILHLALEVYKTFVVVVTGQIGRVYILFNVFILLQYLIFILI